MNDSQQMIHWLLRAADLEASDLHLIAGAPPTVRVHGHLQPMDVQPLNVQAVANMMQSLCTESQFSQFQKNKNLDFAPIVDVDSHETLSLMPAGGAPQLQRFRANFFWSGSQMGACFRIIPRQVPDLRWAGFPIALAERLLGFRNGLILLTGVTGSGKSTSLAMMIQKLIHDGGRRIITIEDPIEYAFPQVDGSLITQREVGQDVQSFADGLKYGLRQDPDVMLVGEIRDRETAQIALSAAETGHLIFATMHTRDAKGAVSRFADLFPQSYQFEIRSQLAMSLRAVISQHLLPSSIPNDKRELALEVMFNTLPIAAAIRNGKVESIDNNILTGRSDGMYLLEESIRKLVASGRITEATARRFLPA